MPTRPQAWRFRTIYEGFEHGGVRIAVDPAASTPLDRVGRVIRLDGVILDSGGRPVGRLTRMLASGGAGLRARHERLELDPAARGHGFARALNDHVEAVYRRMGIGFVTMHAEHVGSLLWPRLGYDFDLRRIRGEDERERRARTVLRMLSPNARRVQGRPRPSELLADWATGEDAGRREAVAAMRQRLPTAGSIARGDYDGRLLCPLSLAAFDAERTRLGEQLMLGASFDAYKPL